MAQPWVVVSALFISLVRAQSGAAYSLSSVNSLCQKTFADANGTGISTFSVSSLGVPTPPGSNSTGEVSWAYTLYENESSTQTSLWYSTGGLDYANDFSLGYDVCAIQLQNTTLLANWRGANDTSGGCLAAFDQDQECIDALNGLAVDSANELVKNPTPTNLTDGSLRSVCQDIGDAIGANFPKKCRQYWNIVNVGEIVLTDHNNASASPNGDIMTDKCEINGTNTSLNPYHCASADLWTGPTSESPYGGLTYNLVPILTIFMPVANSQRLGGIAESFSQLSCLHIDHINPGSQAKPYYPKPPESSSSSAALSGGDIAGIVIGSVAGVALITGIGFWIWRKRRQTREQQLPEPAMETLPIDSILWPDVARKHTLGAESSDDTVISEMSPDAELRPELPTSRSHQKYELANTQYMEPVELSPEGKYS